MITFKKCRRKNHKKELGGGEFRDKWTPWQIQHHKFVWTDIRRARTHAHTHKILKVWYFFRLVYLSQQLVQFWLSFLCPVSGFHAHRQVYAMCNFGVFMAVSICNMGSCVLDVHQPFRTVTRSPQPTGLMVAAHECCQTHLTCAPPSERGTSWSVIWWTMHA
jgi:hypothetical protein